MRYKVTFIKEYEYIVDAVDDCDAQEIAYNEFCREMHEPIACTNYDDCNLECLDGEI